MHVSSTTIMIKKDEKGITLISGSVTGFRSTAGTVL